MELAPGEPLLSRDNLDSMKRDNVASGQPYAPAPELGITADADGAGGVAATWPACTRARASAASAPRPPLIRAARCRRTARRHGHGTDAGDRQQELLVAGRCARGWR
ncbi:MAG: hypothetical protein MZW92_43725 [Comamonadaceae bacterium]|nr:hypothetical protein [Comamonadaceae bacterium]